MKPKTTASWLTGFAVFMLFCTPSMKIFAFTDVLNVMPVALVLISAILTPRRRVSENTYLVLTLCMALFSVLFAFGVYNTFSLNSEEVAKYAVLAFLSVTIPLTVDRKAAIVALILIMVWGLSLALAQLKYGISLDQSRGQHYLTLGYAIGSSGLIGLLVMFSNMKMYLRLFGAACGAMALFGGATLLGRGPILFPLLTFAAYFFVSIVVNKGIASSARRIALVCVLLGPALLIFFQNLSTAVRFNRLLSLSEEPRMETSYLPASRQIAENPFGYGLEAHYQLIGGYPHNVFLEILISGGIVAFVILSAIVALFIRRFPSIAKKNCGFEWRALYLLTFYYFLIWNVSFDFASAYAMVPMMIFFAALRGSDLRKIAPYQLYEIGNLPNNQQKATRKSLGQ